MMKPAFTEFIVWGGGMEKSEGPVFSNESRHHRGTLHTGSSPWSTQFVFVFKPKLFAQDWHPSQRAGFPHINH